MQLRELPRRLLVAHARPEAFAPRTISILGKLGYRIVAAECVQEALRGGEPPRPDLRLVDERRLGEVPDADEEGPVPILLLTGRHGVTGADARIAGAVRRPAGLHDLFRLLQQVLESHPRSTPRVPVHLRARCWRQGREWGGAVLSLSENGCLLRSPEPLPLGAALDLAFQLPRFGTVELGAETSYQLLPDHGLIFHGVSPAQREALSGYVGDALATA